ncbi:phospholipase [Streptomyces sp. 549]|uniref:phospholipase n=1 Tax=Streptomyces sp. 549 TaxID=3049076 RepID=UPI0024C23908|nr:phospholipase [Streptomyces sp. 549]MDK1472732.1 phospholipase [Streptomyces sp. 549]
MRRSATKTLAASGIALTAVIAVGSPANAAPADKPQVLASWTQTSQASYNAWASANANKAAWSAYGFDWTTDYCSSSPDNPFGFPFAASCNRHDFGYRNYKAAGTFPANKNRLDSAFYEDLKRVCARYSGATKSSCDGTAWTYYQAVRLVG